MKAVLAVLVIVASAYSQRYTRPYGYGQGGVGNVGGGFGSGGPIIFPDGNVVVRPVRPGSFGTPGGVAGGFGRPVGAGGGFGTPGGVAGGFGTPGGVAAPVTSGACNRQTLIHATRPGSEYHFSWCFDGNQKYEWQQAISYCTALGPGWQGISIEDLSENEFAKQTILAHNLEYIWTSGQKAGLNWIWASGRPFVGLDWSHTGLTGAPQPDNQEDNAENCLGILNNFYNDGVKWHDIACHHLKPIICEKVGGAFG
ncbi:pulmonary surfactant-associated protein D-like [Macrobrachium nipponense]|uniref:pulmonary surfactant-associated protein D-like n=1 Tax=Macrobrachium nipponense TaxID=159736 RepID=UPI0030C8893D